MFLTLLSIALLGGNLMAQTHRGCGSGSLSEPITTQSTCNNNGTLKIKYTIQSTDKALIGVYRDGSESSPLNEVTVNGASGYHTFEHLGAGKYTVILRCNENLSTIYSKSPGIEVQGPPALNTGKVSGKIEIIDLCGNFETGGTFVIKDLTEVGGTPPYKVSIIKNDHAGYDDSLSDYHSLSSYPYKKKFSDFGLYQIRVKDACGSYATVTRELSSIVPKIRINWITHKLCGNKTKAKFHSIKDDKNVEIQFPEKGVKMVIRENDKNGKILYNNTYKKDDEFEYTPSTTHKYYVETTNPCGLVYNYHVNKSDTDGEITEFRLSSGLSGCPGDLSQMKMKIAVVLNNYWTYPVTVQVRKKHGGNIVKTQTFNERGKYIIDGLEIDDYKVTGEDACHFKQESDVKKPESQALNVIDVEEINTGCTNVGGPLTQEGAIQTLVAFSGISASEALTKVVIKAGPSNVGVEGKYYKERYAWTNMLPGEYTITVTQCGKSQDLKFTVSSNKVLKQSISAIGESFCSGGGSITCTKEYNGVGKLLFELLKENGSEVLDSNATGKFINRAVGRYRVRLKIDICSQSYYVTCPNVIELVDGATGPKILNYIGAVCENSDGSPSSSGSVYLDIVGSKPLTLTYYDMENPSDKKTKVINSSSANGERIEGMLANHKYHFELKDNCGKLTTQDVMVQTLSSSLSVSNTLHPCFDKHYTLEIPQYAGASYVWKEPNGSIISHTRLYDFSSYKENHNGRYTCEISWGDCIRRRVEVVLDGHKCGQPLNSTNYWIGANDNDWNKPANWTATKVPLRGEDVEFATAANNGGKPAMRDLHVPISDPKEIKDLINDSDKDLVVTVGSELKINGEVKDANPSAGTIIVKSSKDTPTGTLVFSKPENNKAVTAIVEFYSKAYDCKTCGMYRRSWQYFGIPVQQVATFPSSDVPGDETINQWVEPFNGDKWKRAPYTPDTELKKFKGYEITNSSTSEPTGVYKMKGQLNVGDADVPLTRTSGVNYMGANLVGNSYTAAIDIKNAINFPSDVKRTVYLFNTGTRDQWRKLNGSTVQGYQGGQYLAVPVNVAGSANLPDRIPSMQTFLVLQESGNSSTLKIIYDKLIKNTTVNDGDGHQIVLRSAEDGSGASTAGSMPTLAMDVLGCGYADRVLFFANERTTDGYDDGWDGYKISEPGRVQLYAMNGETEERFAVSTVPAWTSLTIGFDAPVTGEYAAEFAIVGLASDAELELTDLASGSHVRIKNGSSYTFTAKRGDTGARFRLSYDGTYLSPSAPSSQIDVRASGRGQMTISNGSDQTCRVSISDLSGKQIRQEEVSARQTAVVDRLSSGIYVVRLQGAGAMGQVRKIKIKD